MEVFKKCFNTLLIKENRILKLIFIILGFWLILYTFYTFVAIKPTYTSNEKRKIGINDFPGIMICPEPPYDMDALVSRGFGGAFTYSLWGLQCQVGQETNLKMLRKFEEKYQL